MTWALIPLARVTVVVGLLALFGPAAAAFITAALCGPTDVHDLRRRMTQWRVPARWYLVALLLPVPVSALASGLEYLLGARGPIEVQPISPLGLVVFVLVVGEETGWRGYALPRLLRHHGRWLGSIILGTTRGPLTKAARPPGGLMDRNRPLVATALAATMLAISVGAQDRPAVARPPRSAGPLVVQNAYYPKPGLEDEVYRLRLRASEVRAKLGLVEGRVLRRIQGPDGGPAVIWEAEYPDSSARAVDVERLSASAVFDSIQTRMGTLVARFERSMWRIAPPVRRLP